MHPSPKALCIAVLAVVIPLAAAGNASALGQISYGGCISNDGSGGLCGPANGNPLTNPTDVAGRPDGRTVYVTGGGSAALAVLDRSPGGQVTYAGCVSDDGSGGACADLPGKLLA